MRTCLFHVLRTARRYTMEAIANIWYRCPGVNNAGSERGHRDGGRSCKADVMKGLESDLCHCKYPYPLLTLDNTPSDKLLVFPNDGSAEQIAAFQISIRHGRLCLVIEERVAITGYILRCATISTISNRRTLRTLKREDEISVGKLFRLNHDTLFLKERTPNLLFENLNSKIRSKFLRLILIIFSSSKTPL